MGECSEGAELDQELLDTFGEFIGHMLARGEKVAEQFGVPMFAVKAMRWLDGGMAMKELGRRMRCDPSFVTAVADSLEKRGLARREPNPADRRIKNLVLTPEGLDLKGRLEREMLAHMPWCGTLDPAERKTLLALMRKIVGAQTPAACAIAAQTPQRAGDERAGEVIDALRPSSAG